MIDICPSCGLKRGEDFCDPCLGKLPGVRWACCGHGDNLGYIEFENRTRIVFKPISIFQRYAGKKIIWP